MAKGFRLIDGARGAGCGFLSDAEIDAFLSGTLDAERATAFSEHQSRGCRPCSVFGADMQAFRSVIEDGVQGAERRDFDSRAASQRAELKRELERSATPRRRRVVPTWVLGAAAMVAIVGFVSLQLLDPGATAPSVTLPGGEAYTFEAPAAPPLVRDGGLFARGRNAFADGDYAKAAAAFEKVDESDPLYSDAAFYAGVSHLLNDNDPPAVERLTLARELAIADGLSGNEAAYYLSLAQIELGNHERARELLRGIDGGPNAANAARLLQLLGR
ncbi:MAG: tetratricopeptide repeat protein [Acidobacteria bacterium]|nr:tetratricopeptide repeat protein [Acidobacteriota bacterium]NIQ87132.1 tetratricopeptide repeat protein [Acidobacteriota bacterium]